MERLMLVERMQAAWDRAMGWLRSDGAERVLRWGVVGLSGFFVLLFLDVAGHRLRYPFDVEWVESGAMTAVSRIAHGQPLYAAPSVGYVPFLYAPLYFYVCGLATKLTGVNMMALRLVSSVCALGTLGVLLAFVRRETGSWFAAIASMGIYASLYYFIGTFYPDIGRVDSLFVLLLLLALYCTRFAHPLVAALVWTLAFQTKQSVLPVAIPFLLTYWERKRMERVAMAVVGYLAMAWGSVAWMDHVNGGWYKFYVFGTIHGLPGVMRMAALYLTEVLLEPLSIVFLVVLAALVWTPVGMRSRRAAFYLVGSVVLYPAFWYVHAHRGFGNTMQAVYVWTMLLFGMALARLLRAAESGPVRVLTVVLLLAVVLQLGSQVYNPGQFVPSAVVVKDREGFIEQLRAIPGEVYVVNHSWDAVLAGKEPQAEGEAMGAVVDAGGAPKERMIAEVRAAAMGHRWSAIAIDDGYTDYAQWLTPEELAEYPVQVAASGAQHARFLTSQPWRILLPCSALKDGLAARVAVDGVAPATPACGGR